MRLPPIAHYHFKRPLPYQSALLLQEHIHKLQLSRRKAGNTYPDLLLLLEHRPVYTAGRRQTEEELETERVRLQSRGADFVRTQRGGELTYHGPGQLVGYPLLDLGRSSPPMGIRDYICYMQTALKSHLKLAHGISTSSTDLTGVFTAPDSKIASIGVQVRHRMTTHGFSLNVTNNPLAWFNDVVACGLHDVKATSISTALGRNVQVHEVVPGLVEELGRMYKRDMVAFDLETDAEIKGLITFAEKEAEEMYIWQDMPRA